MFFNKYNLIFIIELIRSIYNRLLIVIELFQKIRNNEKSLADVKYETKCNDY